MRLIDWKRSGGLAAEYYKKIRKMGHDDNLPITEEELMKTLGVEDLTGEEV